MAVFQAHMVVALLWPHYIWCEAAFLRSSNGFY